MFLTVTKKKAVSALLSGAILSTTFSSLGLSRSVNAAGVEESKEDTSLVYHMDSNEVESQTNS